MGKYYQCVIPGLDTLIGDPSLLNPTKESRQLADVFYLPEGYIRTVSSFYSEHSSRGDSCKELTRRFYEILSARTESDDSFCLANGTLVRFDTGTMQPISETNVDSSNEQAILAAKHLFGEKKYKEIAIMTGSDRLAALAALHRIDVVHINPEVYTGRRRVFLSDKNSTLWFSNKKITAKEWADFFPNETPLRYNEFVEFIFDDYGQTRNFSQTIGRFVESENALVPLRYTSFKGAEYEKVRPKTSGQAMLLEALLAPPEEIPIVIVSGTFGTGKTFLSTVAGYYGVTKTETYERIFVCPRDGRLGDEIGFVPGDVIEKTMIKSKPIVDNLRDLFRITPVDKKAKFETDDQNLSAQRDCIDRHVEDALKRYFEFEPILLMGGRSVSHSFLIYDEFQDTERYQAKALLSRIGYGSKMVIMGDPTQLTNPYLNRTSNGLSYSASRLAGRPEAAIVTMRDDEIVRSPAAIAIAQCFS